MMITVNENFGYIKAEKPKMKDFIEPTKKYAEEVKDISEVLSGDMSDNTNITTPRGVIKTAGENREEGRNFT